MKIATHNSATGEKSKNLLSLLVLPFSKCQSKSINLQYKAGCRYFDIRVKKINNTYYCAHGLWLSKRTVDSILGEINSYKDCYAMITYEGKYIKDFYNYIKEVINNFSNIKFTTFNIKKPKWYNIYSLYSIKHINKYKVLNGKTWNTYIPIPWLWKKIYYNKPEFNSEYFTMVDFL